ncbi:MAG: hypothetical protein OES38_02250 [Gammaproteobacteria bacterium]|nr:hypothetical protein [Gammaproteobacteria bacterium]
MNREKIIGAIRFPAFLLIWSAGLVLFMGQLYPADAALIRHSEISVEHLKPLARVPSISDFAALGDGLDLALEASDLGGGWQPEVAVAVSKDHPADDGTNNVGLQIEAARVEQDPVASESTASKSAYNKIVRVAPSPEPDPVAQTKLAARVALKSKRSPQAYALLMRHVDQASDDAEYLGLLAVAALQQQLFAEAQVIYRRLVQIDSGNGRWWAGLALAEDRLGLNAGHAYQHVLKLADDASRLRQLALDEQRRT